MSSSANFAGVQQAITQIVNDNTAQNNAVAAQLQEVQTLLADFASRSNQGNGPSSADYQQAIAQLQAVHSLVQQNTAAIQASAGAITEADPNASSSGGGTQSSASGTGNAGAASTEGGAKEPGTGMTDQTGNESGTSTSSSGVGSGSGSLK